MTTTQDLGQYFTTNTELKQKVLEFVLNEPQLILEPSVGQGDLVQIIHSTYPHISFDMYEIDPTISLLSDIPTNVTYCNFLDKDISTRYNTIIGNPPFVRTTTGNLYIDFIRKCFQLLQPNGELIFIIPSDFFKLTSASILLDTMMQNGSFTHIYHPHKENLFTNASIDVLIFRYCKTVSLENKVFYNNETVFLRNQQGLITFHKELSMNTIMIKDSFDIYVGIVSGRDKIYKHKEFGNITVLNGLNKTDNYIFLETFPSKNIPLNNYLLSHKQELLNRKIKKFNEKNWFEWGAPRNIKKINEHWGKDCIYICNLTRQSIVAFKGKVQYFGGGLLILIPRNKIQLEPIINYLNSPEFKQNFLFSGRFKIGHRQISNSLISQSLIVPTNQTPS